MCSWSKKRNWVRAKIIFYHMILKLENQQKSKDGFICNLVFNTLRHDKEFLAQFCALIAD